MKKQQVLIIRGGDSFYSHKDYIHYLKNKNLTLDRLRIGRGWKSKLGDELGEDFEVFLPEMPNRSNARYFEWKILFEKILPLLNNDLILIGHSLGGIFLAKYLSENKISKKIKSIVLISAPFDEEKEKGESLNDFKLNSSISNFEKRCGYIYLIHSKDDDIVSFDEVKKYKKAIPEAKLITFNNRGHFWQEDFPELVKIIKEM